MLHTIGYNNKFNNLISVMQKMFHYSLHASVMIFFSYNT